MRLMEIKSNSGDVLFASDSATNMRELVTNAVRMSANLGGADLRGADLCDADLGHANLSAADLGHANLCDADLSDVNLSGANLSGANLSDAAIDGKKIVSLRLFAGLYKYQVWAVLFDDGSRWVRMGCLFKSLEEWASINIRKSNISEFPDDGSDESEERVAAFEFAKAAAERLK